MMAPTKWKTIALAVSAGAVPLAIFACSTNGENKQFSGTSSDAASGSGGATASSSATSISVGEGGGFLDGGLSELEVQPGNPILKVALPLKNNTVQFTCLDTKTNMPAAGATWSIDQAIAGSIDNKGLFTASGLSPGKITVTCQSGTATADTQLTVIIHAVDDSGGVNPNDEKTLQGPPGNGDASWQFLYPYDQTVFPKGIVAPEIHLTSGSAPGTAYYVHIVANLYEYEGFFAQGGGNTQLKMSQAAWDALTNAAGGQSVQVNVAKIANGAKYGPIFRSWTLAPGKLHGSVYYNTYNSQIAGNNGAMMRIKGTSIQPDVLVGNCTVCHSISSDGSTAAAANHSGPGGIFDLSGGNVNPPLVYMTPEIAAFAGLFPKNGKVWVVNAQPSWGPTPGSWGPYTSSLYQKNGTIIPASGIEPYYAQSPCFSHDGTKIAFLDRSSQTASSIVMMDYDENTQKFTNYQQLAPGAQGRINAWPAFTPDNKYVLYQSGTGYDLATWSGNAGKIYGVDTTGKQIVYLAVLNGDGYVPQGARDLDKNYEPTTSPIASGGYFWVMFTSRRTYGNQLTQGPDQTKRLWVSALDLNAAPGSDFSHPAFYVPGQEISSGNSRGFWSLDACKPDGQDCSTGDECCNGFCEPKGNPPMFVCGPPNGMCSHEFEACMGDADCCDPTLQCIGGTCTYVPPK